MKPYQARSRSLSNRHLNVLLPARAAPSRGVAEKSRETEPWPILPGGIIGMCSFLISGLLRYFSISLCGVEAHYENRNLSNQACGVWITEEWAGVRISGVEVSHPSALTKSLMPYCLSEHFNTWECFCTVLNVYYFNSMKVNGDKHANMIRFHTLIQATFMFMYFFILFYFKVAIHFHCIKRCIEPLSFCSTHLVFRSMKVRRVNDRPPIFRWTKPNISSCLKMMFQIS